MKWFARLLLVTWFLALLAGCSSKPNATASNLGTVVVALQSPDDAYRLDGTLDLTRIESPAYAQTMTLDGPEHEKIVALPVGSYGLSLAPGFRLLRLGGGEPSDVTHLVTSVRLSPNPVVVNADHASVVVITLVLDDQTRVVFGSGDVDVVLAVDDTELACEGCAAGELCLQRTNGEHECAMPCDPTGDVTAQCGAGATCRRLYALSASDSLELVFVCESAARSQVTLLTPADGAVDVAPSIPQILVQFDRPMDRATYLNNIYAEDEDGVRVSACQYSGEDVYGIVLCGPALKPAIRYTVRVLATVADASGTPLGVDYAFHFSTAAAPEDHASPSVVGVEPVDGATDVSPTISTVTVFFSEPMDRTTYNRLVLTDSTGSRVSACGGPSDTLYQFVFCGALLKSNETYTLSATSELTDLAGNALDPTFSSHFTTGALPDDGQPPRVSAVTPADGSQEVSITTPTIRVTFTEPMARETLSPNVSMTDPSGHRIGACAHTGIDYYELVLCGSILAPNTTYTVRVLPEVMDALGNPMAVEFTSAFTTGPTPL